MDARITNDTALIYHSTKALSKHSMDELLRCPAHFKSALDNMGEEPEKQTDAMLLGSVFHALVLEPEKNEYARKQFNGSTREGKAEAAAAAKAGVTLVTTDKWNTAWGMSQSVRAHELMQTAMNMDDWQTELSIYWTERESIPCKARIDAIATIPGFGRCAIDLKSTTDASMEGISRSIYEYGYHRQAAWYLHALQLAGMECRRFVFLCCEKSSPYLCTAVTVAEAAMQLAMDEIRGALDTYEQCAAAGVWPGYSNDIVTEVDLPAYAYKRVAA